jgi:hypothetical protein
MPIYEDHEVVRKRFRCTQFSGWPAGQNVQLKSNVHKIYWSSKRDITKQHHSVQPSLDLDLLDYGKCSGIYNYDGARRFFVCLTVK